MTNDSMLPQNVTVISQQYEARSLSHGPEESFYQSRITQFIDRIPDPNAAPANRQHNPNLINITMTLHKAFPIMGLGTGLGTSIIVSGICSL